ncbi:MAG: Flp pilus assembly complex ATPase component TadA [Polyangiaceae bacterium]|nr:Flp pilus assembly complex ATPase component TadA [Polyangiaceae bacterium]
MTRPTPPASTTAPPAPPGARVARAIAEIPVDELLRAGGGVSPSARAVPPPEALAEMLGGLALAPGSRVLEVGTGTGYVAAVLSRLAGAVFTLEQDPALAQAARDRLAAFGCGSVSVAHGDGWRGWPEHGPYDAVLVCRLATEVPHALLAQLAPGGSLVLPVGTDPLDARLVCFTKGTDGRCASRELGSVRLASALGDTLVGMGVLARPEIERAAHAAHEHGVKLGDELLRHTRAEATDIYRALALQRGIGFGTFDDMMADADPLLMRGVPRRFLEHNQVIPVKKEAGILRVATSDPDAASAELSKAFPGATLDLWLVTPTDFGRLWSALELAGAVTTPRSAGAASTPRGHDLLGRAGELDARFVALFDAMLLDAIGERASDVHLERYGDHVRLRLRIDGELRDVSRYELSPVDLVGVVNVIKIRANLDIAERRLPQGGRIELRAGGSVYDLRVQTQPALHGEHVVIRLLPQNVHLLTIEELGLPPRISSDYRRLLQSPAGLVLVVGPTGSGKSTTLYAGLQVLASDTTRKVITVEDPIEYSIAGVQQTQVHGGIGFAFADAMRAFVRQDPDVILVGEIRDAETALEALRASQTGHVVLSTLHSNDAVDAVQRLFDLGMHPNSISSELLAVVAQRLAKRVCEGCRVEVQPDASVLAELYPGGAPADFRCWAGQGCARCSGRGTHGRIAAVEYLRLGAEVRDAIAHHPPLDELRRLAIRSGLVTMRDSAITLVRGGTVPLTELPRILPAERMAGERG